MEPIAYRVVAAAKVVGVSKTKMYQLIAEGAVEARRVGSCTVIPAESLRALIANAPMKEAA